MEQLREWASIYEDGLTNDQIDQLATLAEQMRLENRLTAEQANDPLAEYSPCSDGSEVEVIYGPAIPWAPACQSNH
jgi:hypothetical protein